MNRFRFVFPVFLLAAACSSEIPTSPASPGELLRDVAMASASTAVFDNIPALLPPNMPSQGYQCCQTAELGDRIQLSGTSRLAVSATVIMSDWAKHSDYPLLPDAGFDHPITLTIYAVNANPNLPGAVLGTITHTFTIPWRPEADNTCAGGTAWRASNGNCYNGFATPITFDLTGLNLSLPDEFIYGIAYNTNTWGYAPIGLNGPYESLNVALNTTGPTVGTDVEPDAVFWNTANASNYTDGGIGGFNIFRRDTQWTPYSPAVQFNVANVATTAAGCKNGGWKTLSRSNFTTFANQGDCVSYVQNGK